jgi:raffinose/stachyose/melibiose transport system substrate-binding protein
MKLKSFGAAAAAVVLASSLVACSDGDDDDGAAEPTEAGDTGSGTDGGAADEGDDEELADSITLWHNTADSPAVLNLYDNFTAATGIEIELVDIPADAFQSTVTTKWGTGDRPDVLEYHPDFQPMLALNPAETMQDLSDMEFVAKSGNLYDNSGSYGGKVYAAITGFPSVFAIFYNRAVLEDAGVEPPGNFDDLSDICSALEGSGVAPIYESGASLWPTQLLASQYIADLDIDAVYSNEIATNQAKLTDEGGPFLEALHAYTDLRDGGCFNEDYSTGTFENALASVVEGTSALTALHSDVYPQVLAAAGDDEQLLSDTVGFVTVSSTSPVGMYIPGPLGTFYAPKTGDDAKEAAAIAFIDYATGAGYGQLLEDSNGVPMIEGYPQPTGRTDLQESFEAAFEGAQTALLSRVPGFGSFPVEMGKLLNGETTPEQTAENMQAAIEQASKAAGQPGW